MLAASADFGYSETAIVAIGATLLASTIIYVIPRTAFLGAIVLSGYLGGAVASNVRVRHPVFQCISPITFAVLIWTGLYF